MSNIKIQITFETTTPESVEDGDFSDHGFYGPGGWKYSIDNEDFQARVERDGIKKALADMTPEPEEFDSVDDAVKFIRRDGPFEASCSPICTSNHDCWIFQTEGTRDRDYFEKGEETRLNYHIEADMATRNEIIEAVLA